MSLLLEENMDDGDEAIVFSPSFVFPQQTPRHSNKPGDRTFAEMEELEDDAKRIIQAMSNIGAVLL